MAKKFTTNYEKIIINVLNNINNFYDDWNTWSAWYKENEEQLNLSEQQSNKTIKFEKTNSVIDFLINMWEFVELKPYGYDQGKTQSDETNKVDGTFESLPQCYTPLHYLIKIKNIIEDYRDNSLRIYELYDKVDNADECLSYLTSCYNKDSLSYLKNDQEVVVIDDEDKNLNYVDGKNVNEVTLYKRLSNGQLEVVTSDDIAHDKGTFYNLWANENEKNGYFYYSVKGEEENNNNKLIKSNDKFILLLDKIIKSIKGNDNEYKKIIKKYFFEEILDRYRTLNIDEDFSIKINYKERSESSTELLIPTLYNRLNGKAGSLNNPRIIEHSRKWKQQKETESLMAIFEKMSFIAANNTDEKNYIEVEIDIDMLDTEQKKYIQNKTGDIFSNQDDKSIEDYLEKNIFNYCKIIAFVKNDVQNNSQGALEEIIYDLSKTELLASKFKATEEKFIVDFYIKDENLIKNLTTAAVKVNKVSALDSVEGYIKFNYIEHKLQDNRVSSSVSSVILNRNSYYMPKEFISALDDRSFSLTSINKKTDISKNNIRVFKKINSDKSLDFVMDVSDFYLLNGVETMKYVKILSNRGTFILPIKRIETSYEYISSGTIVADNSNYPYITDKNLLSTNSFTETFGSNFTVSIENNGLVINDAGNFEGSKELLKNNTSNDNSLLLNKNVNNTSINVKSNKKKIVYKYLVLEKIDSFFDGIDCSEYFDYLLDREDIVSIIGFSQSQNSEFSEYYLH